MHKIEISPTTMGRVRALRGRTHMFNHLDPARTAHIIVDLQNGFMEPGAAVEIPQAREIVPNVNRISAAVRAAGGLNVFIRYSLDGRVLPAALFRPVPSAASDQSIQVWRADVRRSHASSDGPHISVAQQPAIHLEEFRQTSVGLCALALPWMFPCFLPLKKSTRFCSGHSPRRLALGGWR